MTGGDVKLIDTPNGGDIVVEGGDVKTDDGLATAVYLSLFTAAGYWGGVYSGNLLSVLDENVLTSATRRRIEQAAERDLAWLISERVATNVSAAAVITGPKRVDLTINIDGEQMGPWSINWDAALGRVVPTSPIVPEPVEPGPGPGPGPEPPVEPTIRVHSNQHTVAVVNGQLWVVGRNDYGQLGTNDTADRYHWQRVDLGGVVTDARAGPFHTVALVDGELWVTGANLEGELGLGDAVNRKVFEKVPGLTGVTAIGVGGGTVSSNPAGRTFAISDGVLYSTGRAVALGRLGASNVFAPVTDNGFGAFRSVCGGLNFTLAIEDGTNRVWATGRPSGGVFGDPSYGAFDYPAFVPLNFFADSIEFNTTTATAIRPDGVLFSTGDNTDGEIGNGDTAISVTSWTRTGQGVTSAGSSSTHSAYVSDGQLWASGSDSFGQLGGGGSRRVYELAPLSGALRVALGLSTTFAETADGLFATGGGAFGRLATGDAASRAEFTPCLPFVDDTRGPLILGQSFTGYEASADTITATIPPSDPGDTLLLVTMTRDTADRAAIPLAGWDVVGHQGGSASGIFQFTTVYIKTATGSDPDVVITQGSAGRMAASVYRLSPAVVQQVVSATDTATPYTVPAMAADPDQFSIYFCFISTLFLVATPTTIESFDWVSLGPILEADNRLQTLYRYQEAGTLIPTSEVQYNPLAGSTPPWIFVNVALRAL